MLYLRTLILLLLTCLTGLHAQRISVIDSIENLYAKAKTTEQKVTHAGRLGILYNSLDPLRADSFARLAIEHAELSRDRKIMVNAYLLNAEKHSNMAGKSENVQKALQYYNKAYDLARTNKLEKEMVTALLGMSGITRQIPDADKALNYTTQAFAILTDHGLDSLEARCYMSFGHSYLLKKEKLLALKNYFNAQKIAERRKDPKLLRDSYLNLATFYHSVKQYDKAIDYVVKASETLKDIHESTVGFLRINDLNFMGSLFVLKQQYDLARKNYDEAINLADQLKFDPVKVQSYMNIFNMYLLANKPTEALNYFNQKTELKDFIERTGFNGVIDHAYAYIYTDMNKLDSADYYFKKALPFFVQHTNNAAKMNFYAHYSRYWFKSKQYEEAINLLHQANATAQLMNDLEWQQKTARLLDSAYQLTGDYKTALVYSNTAQHLKDTLDKLGKEEDILQLQLADEDERQARLLLAEEESRKRRHQYQYFMITIGIAVLFVVLVMLGAFKVSAATIRLVGFFTFLMLFEFVFLICKKQLHYYTEGEPWKDLGFMILIAAALLPLHHYVEHKVIHYLTSKQLIKIDKQKYLITRIFNKKPKAKPTEELVS